MIRISAGTAAALGLLGWKIDEPPTTAYLLQTGDGYSSGSEKKCLMECSFCPQSRHSQGPAGKLSRVIWPAFNRERVQQGLSRASAAGIKRVCLQGIRQAEGVEPLLETLRMVKSTVSLPVSVSAWAGNLGEVDRLLSEGAEKVCISLDAASSSNYTLIKGGVQQERLELIQEAALRYPGRMTTHLICGLGETEEELLRLASWLIGEGVTVALFAFTPVRGTMLSSWHPPNLLPYRRVQAALYLLRAGKMSYSSFTFREGRLVSMGLGREELRAALEEGEAFRTSGCPGCNRPYYNEKPGEIPYNYPRPLNSSEKEENFNCLYRTLELPEIGAGDPA